MQFFQQTPSYPLPHFQQKSSISSGFRAKAYKHFMAPNLGTCVFFPV